MTVRTIIYNVICSGCKEEYIGQIQTTRKEILNTYRQHIRQLELQQTNVNGHIRLCGGGRHIVRHILLKNSNLR